MAMCCCSGWFWGGNTKLAASLHSTLQHPLLQMLCVSFQDKPTTHPRRNPDVTLRVSPSSMVLHGRKSFWQPAAAAVCISLESCGIYLFMYLFFNCILNSLWGVWVRPAKLLLEEARWAAAVCADCSPGFRRTEPGHDENLEAGEELRLFNPGSAPLVPVHSCRKHRASQHEAGWVHTQTKLLLASSSWPEDAELSFYELDSLRLDDNKVWFIFQVKASPRYLAALLW